jgi:hypothetical protein
MVPVYCPKKSNFAPFLQIHLQGGTEEARITREGRESSDLLDVDVEMRPQPGSDAWKVRQLPLIIPMINWASA